MSSKIDKEKGKNNDKDHQKSENGTIDMYIEKEQISDIKKLFNKADSENEFEFIFSSKAGKYLTYDKFNRIEKYLELEEYVIESSNTLDIIYSMSSDETIRCTIDGVENINSVMRRFTKAKNHIILGSMVKIWRENNNISFLKKTKTSDQTVDIDDYNLRIRLSGENELSKDELKMIETLDETNMNKITYRYKARKSYIIHNENKQSVKVDMTLTKQDNNFMHLNGNMSNYEIEIEYVTDGKSNKPEILDLMFEKFIIFQKIIQQSNYLVSNSEAVKVINEYRSLLSVDSKLNSLFARQPITLEIQYITDELPNKYAVTDKADGERYFLIIFNLKVYLISGNLDVKYTGIVLNKSLEKYNGSIMDGEYIFLGKQNRYLFMVFDCLRIGHTDIRKTIKIKDRQLKGREIINDCFVFNKQTNHNQKIKWDFEKFDLDKITEAYLKDIKLFMESLNNDILISKNYPLIRHKYFIECQGAKNWEIFAYSTLIWRSFTSDPSIKCPYLLDGLIYHPMEQSYVANSSESQKNDFKLKPPEKNSIDFYVEFEKDPKTGKILTVFDNSYEEHEKNKMYKICKLYVGRMTDTGEKPSPFREDEDLHEAYLFLEDGEVRDAEGEPLNDNTVIEFYYLNNPEVPDKYRWKPLRTRYDKTDSVYRFGRRYGNFYSVADKVWKSIINPVLFSDFEDLAKGNNPEKNNYQYDKKMNAIRSKIGHELIVSTTRENKYYQLQTNLIKPMRTFHNWIKSNLIYTICSPLYKNNKQLSVLDFGCGRGGDIPKFHYARAASVVGFDPSMDGISNPYDSCRSRAANSKKKPGFPKMTFFQGDAGALLNVEDQKRALGGMNNENETLMRQFFSKDPSKRTMFDIINCQFAIHYLFKDSVTWGNCKQNIKDYLRNGGYLIATTFNAKKIIDLIGENDNYIAYYNDQETGKRKILFEIVKKYQNVDSKTYQKNIIGTGYAIDVHMSWISEEGRYLTEYLVDPRFIKQELLEDCDMELVDSDGFDNQLEIHRPYITKYSKNQEDEKTRKYLSVDVAEFYKNNELNKASQTYNSLMQYYVFRKKDENRKQKGGENLEYDFLDSNQFKLGNLDNYDSEYSFLNSLHQLLKAHNMIPEHISTKELYNDISFEYVKDNKINREKIENVGKKMIIEHQVNDKSEIKVNGLNIFVVQRDCNNESNISLYNDKFIKGRKSIILMKDGNLFAPVYKIDKDGRVRGMFNKSDPLVEWMLEEI